MGTSSGQRATALGPGRVSRPGIWRAAGTLAAAVLMLSSLLLTWATLRSPGVSRDLRFGDVAQPLHPHSITEPASAWAEPLFPVATVDKGSSEASGGSSGLSKVPFPGPWLVVLLSAAVALAGGAMLIGIALPSLWTVSKVVLVIGSFAALVGVGEAMTSLTITWYSVPGTGGIQYTQQPGLAPCALGLGSLLALGLLCPAIVAPRDQLSGEPPSGSRAPAIWAAVAIGSAVLALVVGASIASVDTSVPGFWLHAPLLVVAAPIAPLLVLVGRKATPERPLRWLAWTIPALMVSALALMAVVFISTEIIYLD